MPKYKVGDELIFRKSMVRVIIIGVDQKPDPIYGQLYIVAKVEDGKEMVASEKGLAPLSDYSEEV